MQETTTSAAPSAQRVIKKYPNRRLYDTNTSSYITLTEVKQLVMSNEPVVVKDAKSGEDLTRSILLQIILEEEAGGAPMFSETDRKSTRLNSSHLVISYAVICLKTTIRT